MNRLKYRKYNEVVVYVCNELKDEDSYVSTDSLIKHLKLKRSRAWRILTELKKFNFLKLKYKTSSNYYYGVFNSSNLKLQRFEERAKQNIRNSPIKEKKGEKYDKRKRKNT